MIRHISKIEIEKIIDLNDKVPEGPGFVASGSREERAILDQILRGGPPERHSLLIYLRRLGREKLNELAAVMLWGRDGEAEFGNFGETLEHCSLFSADEALMYVMGKRLRLSQYLRDGLNKLPLQ